MRYFMLPFAFFLSTLACAADGLRVDFDEAQINLSTKPDSSWNFMDVNLYLRGDGFDKIQWVYKPKFSKIATDLGKVKARSSYSDRNYPKIWHVEYLSDNDRENQKHRYWHRTGVPDREAKKLVVAGYAEVYMGAPGDVVSIRNYLPQSGRPIKNKMLDQYGIELSFMTKDDLIDMQEKIEEKRTQAKKERREIEDMGKELGNAFSELFVDAFSNVFGFGGHSDLTIIAKDKQGKLLNVELYDEEGNLMKVQSRSFSRNKKQGTFRMGVSYKRMLPHKGTLRIYVDNSGAVKRVPFRHMAELP